MIIEWATQILLRGDTNNIRKKKFVEVGLGDDMYARSNSTSVWVIIKVVFIIGVS